MSNNLTDSPRGPDMGSHDPMKSVAQSGQRAIQELERILFFTDLKDDESRQEAAQEGLEAVERLRLFYDSEDRKGKGSVASPSFDAEERPQYSQSLMSPSSMNCAAMGLMDLLTSHFQSVLDSTHNAIQEAERTMFFTDLDELRSHPKESNRAAEAGADGSHFQSVLLESTHSAIKEAERAILFTDLDELRSHQKEGNGAAVRGAAGVVSVKAGGDVWKEVEVILQDMERQIASFACQASRSSQRAYKECERTLLFTDLDESALAKDKSKDDVISHFLNSQDVMQEMNQKFFGTSIEDENDNQR